MLKRVITDTLRGKKKKVVDSKSDKDDKKHTSPEGSMASKGPTPLPPAAGKVRALETVQLLFFFSLALLRTVCAIYTQCLNIL